MKALLVVTLFSATAAFAAQPLQMSWTVEGVQRHALVYAPAPGIAAARVPVIFAFHGHGGTAEGAAQLMKFQQLVPQAVVVYPMGLPIASHVDPAGTKPGWQQTPGQEGDRDLKFFDAMLQTIRQKYPVNEKRVYVTGFSNGSLFSLLLWAERGKELAAIGVVAGVLRPEVHLTVPRPVIHIAGKQDHTAEFSLQLQTMQTERDFNGCSGTGQPCGPGCKRYASTKQAPVMNIIHPGGHVYPPWASSRVVKFFELHSLP